MTAQIDKFELNVGNDLEQRIIKSQQDKQQKMEGGLVIGGITEGDYSNFKHDNVSQEGLLGFEEILYHKLEKILSENIDKNKPTIFLDFGGGFGLSDIRLAKAFEKYITSGDLIIAVSNLEVARPTDIQAKKNLRIEEFQFYIENKNLIQGIQGDATDLLGRSVHSKKYGDILLMNNVNLLHEHLALVHGSINDLDLPRLTQLLTDHGTFLLGSDSKLHFPLTERENISESRQTAHNIGLLNLRGLGYSFTDLNYEKQHYSVVSK